MGFNLACELLIHDLQAGGRVDGYGRPMPHALTGQPAVYYALLRMSIPRLARAAGGDDFEVAVRAVQDEVRQKLSESVAD